jgi:hypothetical protein
VHRAYSKFGIRDYPSARPVYGNHSAYFGPVIICNRKKGHSDAGRICEMITLNEIHYNLATHQLGRGHILFLFVIPSLHNHWFPFDISGTVAHIFFKFGIWIHHRIMQVKCEFGLGAMICDRVILFELRKIETFGFRSLTFVCMYAYG